MLKDIIVLLVFAVVGTAVCSLITGLMLWYLPWLYVLPAFLTMLVVEALFVTYLENLVVRMGYKFHEQRS